MNPQSSYVDVDYSYVDVARSFDMCTVSASPSFYYVQKPMQNNLHASTHLSNLQHVNSNSHASATPEIHMPMNNMTNSVNPHETRDFRNFNGMQPSVSSLYSSANNLQSLDSSSNMPMDREIGHATTSHLLNYSQSSYATLC